MNVSLKMVNASRTVNLSTIMELITYMLTNQSNTFYNLLHCAPLQVCNY